MVAELRANCLIYLEAWNSIRLKSIDFGNEPFTGATDEGRFRIIDSIWGAAYASVEAACRLSRILWGTQGCKELRGRFGVPVDSPLRDGHKVRNVLEHIEARIPEFVRSNPGKKLAGWIVDSNPEGRPIPGVLTLRYLNLGTWNLKVYDPLGDMECNLRSIAEAVQRLNLVLPETLSYGMRVDADATELD
jgi:hypothetical protein